MQSYLPGQNNVYHQSIAYDSQQCNKSKCYWGSNDPQIIVEQYIGISHTPVSIGWIGIIGII